MFNKCTFAVSSLLQCDQLKVLILNVALSLLKESVSFSPPNASVAELKKKKKRGVGDSNTS